MNCDVAIIGGGPAGSTVGTLLKKYNPKLKVTIVEKAVFPRDHVGESHLPAISDILAEMEVWEKVEAANFPIKIGATYRWGRTDDLWDFEFIPGQRFEDKPRPEKFEGQRQMLAFQVDRSIYDKVLLDHAESLGCEVRQGTSVKSVRTEGKRITGLELASGETIEAKHYVDASGDAGILRKAVGVEVESPTKLRNIAIWDYWQDAEWAVSIGRGGTRIQILSIGWGWLWFIPITETRTSIGLVVPAEYFKSSGKSTEQIYLDAIAAEPLVTKLTQNATRENVLSACKDWSFVSQKLCDENWFLAGDTCGFADPILSAGMTLAHTGARRVAYTILELERGKLSRDWLLDQYNTEHRRQIHHHVRFADYWYSANGIFTDLKEYCTEIASSVGLKLNADDAFRWLATGGFTSEMPGRARALSYSVNGIKFITQLFGGEAVSWEIAKHNVLHLDTRGAELREFAHMENGVITPVQSYWRDGNVLPLQGVFAGLHEALQRETDAEKVVLHFLNAMKKRGARDLGGAYIMAVEALEAMVADGWIRLDLDPSRPLLKMETPEELSTMHVNRDNRTV